MDLQAIGRAHRLGQTRQVLVLRLISEGLDCQTPSAEQELLHTANKKLQAEREVLVIVVGFIFVCVYVKQASGKFDLGSTANASSETHHIVPFDIFNFEYGQGVKLLEPTVLSDLCHRTNMHDIIPSDANYTELQENVDRRFDPWLEVNLRPSDLGSLNTSKSTRGRRVSCASLNEDERWEMVCFIF